MVRPRRTWAISRRTGRQVELLERADRGGTEAQTSPGVAALAVQAAPEPAQVLEGPREPAPRNTAPSRSSAMAWDAIDAANWRRVAPSIAGPFHVADQAAKPQLRRRAGLEVDVGGALIDGELEQLLEIHDGAYPGKARILT